MFLETKVIVKAKCTIFVALNVLKGKGEDK